MSREAASKLYNALSDNIDYFRQEFEINYAELIGVLEMLKLAIYAHEIEDIDEDDDDNFIADNDA